MGVRLPVAWDLRPRTAPSSADPSGGRPDFGGPWPRPTAGPARAAALLGWDPVTFAVGSRTDLDTVAERLDQLAVEHGPIIEATLGWLLAAPGPDGQQVRFYTLEHHTPTPSRWDGAEASSPDSSSATGSSW